MARRPRRSPPRTLSTPRHFFYVSGPSLLERAALDVEGSRETVALEATADRFVELVADVLRNSGVPADVLVARAVAWEQGS